MIVVTGANGFIGSAFVWQLNQAGIDDILCVDSIPPGDRPGPLSKRKYAKFLNHTQYLESLQNADSNIHWVVHMGACSSTTELDKEYLRQNNTLYTQKIWEWCEQRKTPLIYASSGAVYGDGTKGFNDATSPEEFTPLNPYGESKLNFDRWAVRQTATPPQWYGLRFFNVYGPNEYHKGDMTSVVYKAFHQIQDSGHLRLFRSHRPEYKDGEQMRDFVYVKDITRWMAELIQKKPASGIYNMGFGRARTWLDLAQNVFASLGRPMKIDWMDIPTEMRARYQYLTEAKMERLLALGMSSPAYTLEEGVADYVKNHLAQSDPYL